MEEILKEIQNQITLIGCFVCAFVFSWFLYLICKVLLWFDDNFQVKKSKDDKDIQK